MSAYTDKLKELMKTGMSYQTASSQAQYDHPEAGEGFESNHNGSVSQKFTRVTQSNEQAHFVDKSGASRPNTGNGGFSTGFTANRATQAEREAFQRGYNLTSTEKAARRSKIQNQAAFNGDLNL